MNYDIIGDVHGHGDKLEALLAKLGYQHRAGHWSHRGRLAIFVGDFIDRGPHQLKTVDCVRRMIDAGSALAVMGNHELNAIAWHTPDPLQPGEFLRPHAHPRWGAKNRHQHAQFLAEVEHDPVRHGEVINWFKTLPLWLDLPEIRVVHACWHQPSMDFLKPRLGAASTLPDALLAAAVVEPTDQEATEAQNLSVFSAVETLTKGIEIPLPAPHAFHDKDGIERRRVRIRWWDPDATDYPRAALLDSKQAEVLPRMPIPPQARVHVPCSKPLFFGHYWLHGQPGPLGPHVACVDFSVGKGGKLAAYRFDGEEALMQEHFVWVGP